jgi:hypothetical protein
MGKAAILQRLSGFDKTGLSLMNVGAGFDSLRLNKALASQQNPLHHNPCFGCCGDNDTTDGCLRCVNRCTECWAFRGGDPSSINEQVAIYIAGNAVAGWENCRIAILAQ